MAVEAAFDVVIEFAGRHGVGEGLVAFFLAEGQAEIVGAVIAAVDFFGERADAEFFGVADAGSEEGFGFTLEVELPDFLALGIGGGFVGEVAAVADGGVDGVVGDEDGAPPVAASAGEGIFGKDGFDVVGDAVVVGVAGAVDGAGLGEIVPAVVPAEAVDGLFVGDEFGFDFVEAVFLHEGGDGACAGLGEVEVAFVVEFHEAGFGEFVGGESDAVAGADPEVGDVGVALAAASCLLGLGEGEGGEGEDDEGDGPRVHGVHGTGRRVDFLLLERCWNGRAFEWFLSCRRRQEERGKLRFPLSSRHPPHTLPSDAASTPRGIGRARVAGSEGAGARRGSLALRCPANTTQPGIQVAGRRSSEMQLLRGGSEEID